MTDYDQLYKVLDEVLWVSEVRDPEENKKRHKEKEEYIQQAIKQVSEDYIAGGTRKEFGVYTSTGISNEWEQLKRAIMLRDPVCRICGKRPTKEVHHIRPRFLKGTNHPRNLIGLCFECHDEVHRKIDNSIQECLMKSLDIVPPQSEYEAIEIDYPQGKRKTKSLESWMEWKKICAERDRREDVRNGDVDKFNETEEVKE